MSVQLSCPYCNAGVALINLINKERQGTPVLVVSAMPASIYRGIMKALDAWDYLQKTTFGEAEFIETFLEVVTPARIEATLEAFNQLEQQRQARDQLWQQRIERAEYAAERARRQYSRVEPENRLVARELETQWNSALQALNDVKQAYSQAQATSLSPLSPAERALVTRLVEDLPQIWNAATTTPSTVASRTGL